MLVTVVLGWFAVVSPAGAATGTIVATPKYIPASGPVLAGDRAVLWVARRGNRVLELWAWTRARGTRRLQRFGTVKDYDLNQPGFFGSVYLSASSTHVGLELHTIYAVKGDNGTTLGQTFLGRLGKRLRQVRQCRDQRFQRSLELEGTTAVFRGPTCDQTVTRDLSVGAGSDRRFGGDIFQTRLSDAHEAWVETAAVQPTAQPPDEGTLVVRDRRTGSELTRVPVDPPPSDLSLRADGTVAFATAARPYDDHYDTRVAVLDPAATTARILPLRLRWLRLSDWIGPDLAVVAADRPGSTSGVLQLIDAQGQTTRRIAELGEDPELLNLTDLNGSRAAWVTRGCKNAQIRSMPLTAGTAALRPDRCRLRLAGSTNTHGGRLRLGISCAGFDADCGARVTVRVGRRVIARGNARPRVKTPGVARAGLRILRTGRALLRTHSRVRVRVSARIGRFAGLGGPALPGEVTRRVTVTIRR